MNSLRHNLIYGFTNTALAEVARKTAPSTDIAALSMAIAAPMTCHWSLECFIIFHDDFQVSCFMTVSMFYECQCFKSVSQCLISISQCLTSISQCFENIYCHSLSVTSASQCLVSVLLCLAFHDVLHVFHYVLR